MKKVLPGLFLISFLAVLLVPTITSAYITCSSSCTAKVTVDCDCNGAYAQGNVHYCYEGVRYTSAPSCGTTGGTGTPQPWFSTNIDEPGDIIALIDLIGRWIFTALLGIAAIFLVVAGFMFIMAAGNTEKVKTARMMLTNALIGVAIALAAQGMVSVIKGFLR